MGRIAEALKKADEERATVVAVPPSGPMLDDPLGVFDRSLPEPCDAAPSESPASGRGGAGRAAMGTAERRWALDKADPSLVALNGNEPVLIEQYRALRTRLLSQSHRGRSQVIAVTSSLAGEGKSVTTANLGLVMAEVKHLRVLLVDGDFRRSRLAGLFGLQVRPGLVEALKGEASIEAVMQETPTENLHVIAAGDTSATNPAEVLCSKRAMAVFDELRDRFGYILVDTPPCGDVADAGIIGQIADAAVMIVRLGRTPQPTAKRIVQMLRASKVNLLGCVLVGSDESRSTYGYDDCGYQPPDDGT